MEPFRIKQREPARGVARLFAREPRGNALIALNNALAKANRATDVDFEVLRQIERRHAVRLHQSFADELCELYRDYLMACLRDHQLDAGELDGLGHMQRLLGVPPAIVGEMHERAVREVYGRAVDAALDDRRLESGEYAFLLQLRRRLGLSRHVAGRIHSDSAQRILHGDYPAAADDALSEDQERDLELLMGSLGIVLEPQERSLAMLERLRVYWRIQEGELPVLDVPIELEVGERCHQRLPVVWHPTAGEVGEPGHAGLTGRMRVAGGPYYRSADLHARGSLGAASGAASSGDLYVTNHRLLLRGAERDRSLSLASLVGIEVFADGVQLRSDGAASPFLAMARGSEVLGLLLDRLLAES